MVLPPLVTVCLVQLLRAATLQHRLDAPPHFIKCCASAFRLDVSSFREHAVLQLAHVVLKTQCLSAWPAELYVPDYLSKSRLM